MTNDKTNWLAAMLSGWGIRESWAKIIAGAIIGALCAAGLLTSCRTVLLPHADFSSRPLIEQSTD